MRLGISSYTYVWAAGMPGQSPPMRPLMPLELLDKATMLGVHVVQFADNMPLERLAERELDALASRAAELGIFLEAGTCGIAADRLQAGLRVAVRLGSPLLRIVLDDVVHRPSPDEVVAELSAQLPAFERAGVCLAIENHDRFRAKTLAHILERLNSRQAGICLDTANSIGCVENLDTLLAVLGPWIVNLHVKDYEIFRPPHRKGFVVEGRPAGAGQLDVPALLASLKAAGRDPNAIVELWPPPEDDPTAAIAKEEAWALQSVRYLRQFIPD